VNGDGNDELQFDSEGGGEWNTPFNTSIMW
jgi:hypothetical protein